MPTPEIKEESSTYTNPLPQLKKRAFEKLKLSPVRATKHENSEVAKTQSAEFERKKAKVNLFGTLSWYTCI